jgi:hypothetical protein
MLEQLLLNKNKITTVLHRVNSGCPASKQGWRLYKRCWANLCPDSTVEWGTRSKAPLWFPLKHAHVLPWFHSFHLQSRLTQQLAPVHQHLSSSRCGQSETWESLPPSQRWAWHCGPGKSRKVAISNDKNLCCHLICILYIYARQVWVCMCYLIFLFPFLFYFIFHFYFCIVTG